MWSRTITFQLFLICLLAQPIFGQEKRVLLVPFDKFQFESTISLSDIANYNQIENPEEVYPIYADSLIHYMNQSQKEIVFYSLSRQELNKLRSKIPREYKKEPVTHFGVNLEALTVDSSLQSLMENMGADYILFICRYKVIGKILTSRFSFTESRIIKWSNHLVDFEIYDRQGHLSAGGERYHLSPRSPRASTYLTEGTFFTDLKRSAIKWGDEIYDMLERHERKGKVPFSSN